MRGTTRDYVLLLRGAETRDVMGSATETEVFTLEQTTVTSTYYVDRERRLVGADLGYLAYSLTDLETTDER